MAHAEHSDELTDPTQLAPGTHRHTVEIRGFSYAVDRVDPGKADPLPRVVRTRTQSSAVTFGLWGRVAATFGALIPSLAFAVTGDFFWLLMMFASWMMLPWVLRDIWRAVDRREP